MAAPKDFIVLNRFEMTSCPPQKHVEGRTADLMPPKGKVDKFSIMKIKRMRVPFRLASFIKFHINLMP